jgi:hypothetical protein
LPMECCPRIQRPLGLQRRGNEGGLGSARHPFCSAATRLQEATTEGDPPAVRLSPLQGVISQSCPLPSLSMLLPLALPWKGRGSPGGRRPVLEPRPLGTEFGFI